jgi:heme-degrading monooxygenase HmoA
VILEVAPLRIRAGQTESFENTFRQAQAIISAVPGYISHELQRCVERPDEYVLLVRWESIDAHQVDFRGSPEYEQWRKLLHHYYDPFPTVLHYEAVEGVG